MPSPMLASDLDNPAFAGAMNPDSALHVEFFIGPVIEELKSRQAGKRIYRTRHVADGPELRVQIGAQSHTYQPMKDTGEVLQIPQIRIQRPGDNTSIIEREVIESDKARWPNQWLYFAQANGLVEGVAEIPGWRIEDWPHVNGDAETVRNLKYQRFMTVEQIAGASDAQVQRLGMGGAGLRKAAQEAVRSRVSEGINKELAAKDKLIAEQGDAIKALQKQMQELMEAATKPKRG